MTLALNHLISQCLDFILQVLNLFLLECVFFGHSFVVFGHSRDQMSSLTLLEVFHFDQFVERIGDIFEQYLSLWIGAVVQLQEATLLGAALQTRADRLLNAFVAKHFLAFR